MVQRTTTHGTQRATHPGETHVEATQAEITGIHSVQRWQGYLVLKTPEKINHWRGLHEGPRGMRSWNDLEVRMGFAPQSLLGRLAEEGVGARYVYNEAEAPAAWGTRPWPPPRHEVRM